MYTDEDLQRAVDKGIFTASAVSQFRADSLQHKETHIADEEDFKLISSFNDIFVLIACALLLMSAGWVLQAINTVLAMIVIAGLSWGLAEFFVRKRKLALPAIALLMAFVGSIFAAVVFLFSEPTEIALMTAASVASFAAWLHWQRFKVPITVAAGTAAAATFIVALLVSLFPSLKAHLMMLMFFGGLVIFSIAMRWDMADLKRISGKSDVAFWLHLTAAPLIVHPVFFNLGIFEGNPSQTSLSLVLLLYLILTLISLVIDRRAFMVSALMYVLSALTDLLQTYGLAGDSFAYVGAVIGFSLILLSGFWHKVRYLLVKNLPQPLQAKVPVIGPW